MAESSSKAAPGNDETQRADAILVRPGPYAWYVLFVLFVVYALSLLDRQILSILAQDVKRDLSLSDAQLGFLFGTAFAIFYTIFGMPLGRLADGWRRKWLMAAGLGLWSVMTMLSGLSSSYAQLGAARIGVGVGEAAASPCAYSILAATFPKHRRALAIAIYSAGSYLGAGLSLPLGGWISDSWNRAYAGTAPPLGLVGWQIAFLAVGVPGLLVAAWVLTLREPPRHSEDGKPQPSVRPDVWRQFANDLVSIIPPFTLLSSARHPGGLARNVIALVLIALICLLMVFLTGDAGQWVTYCIGLYAITSWIQSLRFTDPPAYELFWKRRTLPLCVLGLGCAGLTYNTFTLWASPFAIRTYGVTASEVGAMIGIPGAIAAVAGSIFGGFLADRWKRYHPGGRVYSTMLAAGVPIPLVILMFTRPDVESFLLICPVVYFFTGSIIGGAITALQDLALPRMYGTVGAIFLVGQTMIGMSFGPYFSGKIATVTGSLPAGIFTVLLAPLFALFVLSFVARRVRYVEENKLAWAVAAGERPSGT